MGSGATIKIDLKGIEKKVSSAALAKGKLAIANQMLLDMERFVPRKRGELRSSGHAQRDSVVYNKPYARAQFYGGAYNKNRSFTFSKYTTAGTGKRWDKKATPLYAKEWAKTGLKAMGVRK
ncbi:minor capsid protein [Streptococcus sp. H49]|uniref:minor capsid protein n=1 Tax=Streptococcus huangxiaojuni TaxID=3237239 RepID=UPI0034A5B65F